MLHSRVCREVPNPALQWTVQRPLSASVGRHGGVIIRSTAQGRSDRVLRRLSRRAFVSRAGALTINLALAGVSVSAGHARRYAARERCVMICASSRFVVPSASNDLTNRSRDTVGSPDSIFATRDWLNRTALASCIGSAPARVDAP
jgi:hypothetical protein